MPEATGLRAGAGAQAKGHGAGCPCHGQHLQQTPPSGAWAALSRCLASRTAAGLLHGLTPLPAGDDPVPQAEASCT